MSVKSVADLKEKLGRLSTHKKVEDTISRITNNLNWEKFMHDYKYGDLINPGGIKDIVEEYYDNTSTTKIPGWEEREKKREIKRQKEREYRENIEREREKERVRKIQLQRYRERESEKEMEARGPLDHPLGVERYSKSGELLPYLSGEDPQQPLVGGDVAILVDGVLEIHKRNSKRKSRRNRKSNKSRKKLKKSKRRR